MPGWMEKREGGTEEKERKEGWKGGRRSRACDVRGKTCIFWEDS